MHVDPRDDFQQVMQESGPGFNRSIGADRFLVVCFLEDS